MGFTNHDYYGGGGGDDFLSNPASILQLSIPAGTYGPVRVRLHFWLLLTLLFDLVSLFDSPASAVFISIAMLFAALIIHDFGHLVTSRLVGGTHHEWTWWPMGSMIMPQLPPGAWPLFVGSIGGIAFNLVAAIGCGFWMSRMGLEVWNWRLLNPTSAFGVTTNYVILALGMANWGIAIFNFMPFYWFDGGYLLQAILWPFVGLYQAINTTCIIGMVVAATMALIALRLFALLMLLFAVCLFASAYMRRKQLQAEGVNELESSIQWSASARAGDKVRRPWKMPGWAQKKAREAAQRRKEEEQIDAILAKVSAQGMQSLTNKEKKILATASNRQRRESR